MVGGPWSPGEGEGGGEPLKALGHEAALVDERLEEVHEVGAGTGRIWGRHGDGRSRTWGRVAWSGLYGHMDEVP